MKAVATFFVTLSISFTALSSNYNYEELDLVSTVLTKYGKCIESVDRACSDSLGEVLLELKRVFLKKKDTTVGKVLEQTIKNMRDCNVRLNGHEGPTVLSPKCASQVLREADNPVNELLLKAE